MRNIGRIFIDDLRLLGGSIASTLVVLVLCLVPVMFAWISITGSWEPFTNTAQLKVAVANSDEGYESSLMPVRLNIGDRVVGMLRENDEYDWVFVDENHAVEGVRSGEYYAAIVMPGDFSSKMMSVISSDVEQANVAIWMNMKENPVAPLIAGAGDGELEEGIRSAFVRAIDEMALGLASDLVSFAGGNNAKEFSVRLVAHLDDVAEGLDDVAEQIRALATLADASTAVASTTNEGLEGSEDVAGAVGKIVANSTEALDAAIGSARSATSDIERQVSAAKDAGGLSEVGTEAASRLASDVTKLDNSVASLGRETSAVSTALDEVSKNLSNSNNSVVKNLNSAHDKFGVSANKLNAASAKVRKFQDDVASAIARGSLTDVATIVRGNTAVLDRWLAEPVNIERKAVYPIENLGSSQVSFYTVLALWAGAVLLVFVMKTGISSERLRRYEEQCGRPVGCREQYVGRSLVFALIMFLQATVVGLGDLFFLHVQCANPLLFMVACWACALVFGGLAYALVASFGGMGKAMCVLLLVAPVVSAVGAYPMQMMGDVFQAINPFLPFTYGIRALQACVAGIYGMEYAYDLLFLGAFLVFALVLGLALRTPLVRGGEVVRARLRQTGLM